MRYLVFSFPVARRRRGRFVDYQPDQGDAYDENETLTRPGYEGARSCSRERAGGTGGVERKEVGVTLTARGGTDYTGGRRQRGLSLQTSERWRVDFSVSSSSRAASSLIFSFYGQHTVTRRISVFRLHSSVLRLVLSASSFSCLRSHTSLIILQLMSARPAAMSAAAMTSTTRLTPVASTSWHQAPRSDTKV